MLHSVQQSIVCTSSKETKQSSQNQHNWNNLSEILGEEAGRDSSDKNKASGNHRRETHQRHSTQSLSTRKIDESSKVIPGTAPHHLGAHQEKDAAHQGGEHWQLYCNKGEIGCHTSIGAIATSVERVGHEIAEEGAKENADHKENLPVVVLCLTEGLILVVDLSQKSDVGHRSMHGTHPLVHTCPWTFQWKEEESGWDRRRHPWAREAQNEGKSLTIGGQQGEVRETEAIESAHGSSVFQGT